MAKNSHPGIENVCLTLGQVMLGLGLGVVISAVALWWGIAAH